MGQPAPTRLEHILPRERWLPLVEAIERLAAAVDVHDVIAVVKETAREISGADGVCFVLKDEDRCHYVEENAIGPLWKGKRFPLTACISGWCMLNGAPAAIPDIYADPRIPHDAYRPTFVKSLVMVPVGLPAPVAAIGSYWATQRNFDEGELALLEALARSTAAALATVQMRASLKDSGERLALALAAGDLGAWEFDLIDRRFIASALCQAHFGRAAEEIAYDDLLAAIHPEERARVSAAFTRAAARGSDFALEFRTLREDGSEHWVALRGRAIRDESGAPTKLAGVSSDVTEEKNTRERLERLQNELAHAARSSEMGQMASALAHELTQPLTAATNYLAAARRTLPEFEGRAIDTIGKAEAQMVRAGQIISRIRHFISRTSDSRQPEEPAPVIAEAVELAQLMPQHRGVEIVQDVASDLPQAMIDKVQIQQVLLNLLRNAFEAMQESAERRLTITARPKNGMIEVRVRDTGPGLAPEVAARLFMPFTTTKASGMGVGLSLCRTIIENQGGEMWADVASGPGATFCFTMPAAKEPSGNESS